MEDRILVVDDEPDFLASIRRGLITSGFKSIQTESDPLVAVHAIDSGEVFDIALIDITMPGMNGIELLQFLKKAHPGTECIMISALDEAAAAVDCLKKGAYDYLVKPVSRENLVSAILRALERRRLLDIVNIGKKTSVPGILPKINSLIDVGSIHSGQVEGCRVIREVFVKSSDAEWIEKR